uniref:Uncharacterized protein n=1 Tax=Glossina palpalis gambiensis TaxID=67801 RepID=A0A1B0BBP8_9MUSC
MCTCMDFVEPLVNEIFSNSTDFLRQRGRYQKAGILSNGQPYDRRHKPNEIAFEQTAQHIRPQPHHDWMAHRLRHCPELRRPSMDAGIRNQQLPRHHQQCAAPFDHHREHFDHRCCLITSYVALGNYSLSEALL